MDPPPSYYPSSTPPVVQQPYPSSPIQQSQSTMVVVQQPPQVIQQMTTPPADYLCWSIFGCLFCFWPIGLCAIVASVNARSAANGGDLDSAKTNSNAALGLNITNTVIGVIAIIALIALVA